MVKANQTMNKQEVRNVGIWVVQDEERAELAGSLGLEAELCLAVGPIETVSYTLVSAHRLHEENSEVRTRFLII